MGAAFAGPDVVVEQRKAAAAIKRNAAKATPSVAVVGAGPVGLTFAILLAEAGCRVVLYDRRCSPEPNGSVPFEWQLSEPGPRDQVLTLGDEAADLVEEMCGASPATCRAFRGERFWPTSRNVVVKELEERLLSRAQDKDVAQYLEFKHGPPREVCRPGNTSATMRAEYRRWLQGLGTDIIVAADGAQSPTREALNFGFRWTALGAGDPQATEVDFALGVGLVEHKHRPPWHRSLDGFLTLAQTRYFLNSAAQGHAYLNIRLSRAEFEEAERLANAGSVPQLQETTRWPSSFPLQMVGGTLTGTSCGQAGQQSAALPTLRQCVVDGARIFGFQEDCITSLTASSFRPAFAQVFHYCSEEGPCTCLIGDAAIAHHYWPGRGLTAGIKAAGALAQTILSGETLHNFEFFMQRLRRREMQGVSRAMLLVDHGLPRWLDNVKTSNDIARVTQQVDRVEEAVRLAASVRAWRNHHERIGDKWPHAPLADQEIDRWVAQVKEWTQPASLRLLNDSAVRVSMALSGWPTHQQRAVEVRPDDAMSLAEKQRLNGALEEALVIFDKIDHKHMDVMGLISRGSTKMQQGHWDDALEDLNSALALEPDNPSALAQRSIAKRLMGRQTEAVQDFDASILRQPGNAFALVRRAMYKLHNGKLADAIDDLDSALLREPGNVMALAHRGEAKRLLGRIVDAESDLDGALNLEPCYVPALVQRGDVRRTQGRFAEALSDFDLSLSREPGNLFALGRRGAVKLALGQYHDALRDFDAALEKERGDIFVLSHHGAANCELGNWNRALVELNSALDIEQNDVLALFHRGRAKAGLGYYEEAVMDFDRVLELDPQNMEAMAARGCAKRKQNNFTQAIEDFDVVLQTHPDNVEMLTKRSEAQQNLGRHAQALEDANNAVTLKSNYLPAVAQRGTMLRIIGKTADALKDLDEAIAAGVGGNVALASRGTARLRMGMLQEALDDFDVVLQGDPTDVCSQASRGEAKRLLGRMDDALEDFDAAISFAPRDCLALACRGVARCALGRLEDAAKDWEAAGVRELEHAIASSQQGAAELWRGSCDEAALHLDTALACRISCMLSLSCSERALVVHATEEAVKRQTGAYHRRKMGPSLPSVAAWGRRLLPHSKKVKLQPPETVKEDEVSPSQSNSSLSLLPGQTYKEPAVSRSSSSLCTDGTRSPTQVMMDAQRMPPSMYKRRLEVGRGRGEARVRMQRYAEALDGLDTVLRKLGPFPKSLRVRDVSDLFEVYAHRAAELEIGLLKLKKGKLMEKGKLVAKMIMTYVKAANDLDSTISSDYPKCSALLHKEGSEQRWLRRYAEALGELNVAVKNFRTRSGLTSATLSNPT